MTGRTLPTHFPLEDLESAEAGRVGERGRFTEPAAVLQRLEVTDVGARLPRAACLFHHRRQAVRDEELGLEAMRQDAAHCVQLIDSHLAGDVLFAEMREW